MNADLETAELEEQRQWTELGRLALARYEIRLKMAEEDLAKVGADRDGWRKTAMDLGRDHAHVLDGLKLDHAHELRRLKQELRRCGRNCPFRKEPA